MVAYLRPRKELGLSVARAAILLIALAPGGCKKPPAAAPRLPPLVTIAEAVKKDVPVYLDEIGACTALEVVAVRPLATGQIVARSFVDGDEVKKGDPLFTIDPRPYQAALDQAKAALVQNEASLTLAKSELARAERLLPDAIAKEEYEVRKSAYEVALAQIESSQAAIEVAKVNLEYCYIYSPLAGRTGMRLVDTGNVVTANSGTVLLVIEAMDPIYADFTVTERDLSSVRRQMAAGTLKAQVRLPDEPADSGREGDLTFIDNTVVETTGTVKLRATVPNADRRFWPGQFVRVRLILRIQPDAVLVPSAATQSSQNGPFVYVVRPDSTAELRMVQLGQLHGELVVVTAGLQAGEKVVATGQLTVIPGQPVRIGQPSSPDQGTSQPASQPAPQPAAASVAQAPAPTPPPSGGRP